MLDAGCWIPDRQSAPTATAFASRNHIISVLPKSAAISAQQFIKLPLPPKVTQLFSLEWARMERFESLQASFAIAIDFVWPVRLPTDYGQKFNVFHIQMNMLVGWLTLS